MGHHSFQSIGIIAKPNDPRVAETLTTLLECLSKNNVKAIMDPVAGRYLSSRQLSVTNSKDMAKSVDLAITIGGDGTLLTAAQSMVESRIPLIGINLGRLGFLTGLSPEDLNNSLALILRGDYTEETRSILQAELHCQGTLTQQCLAINDVVVHAREAIRMIELETKINGCLLNHLRADGLIISTPTGSTAYALSGGGPIIEPNVPATLLVPICPHTLSNRPIVVNDSSEIQITFSSQNEVSALASIDGQINHDLTPGDCITIRKSNQALRLIQPSDHNHFGILRKKLGWSHQP